MAISYLSKPLESKIQPFRENVGLIAQVAQQKQNKYDTLANAIFQRENQLLDLDTSANADITKTKDALLKQVDTDLSSMASLDLLNPENIKKVEGIFNPITENGDITLAAAVTKHAKDESKFFDEWKKKGSDAYSALNEQYFWNEYGKNRDMSAEDFRKNYVKPVATKYTDIDAKFLEAASKLKDAGIKTSITASRDGYLITRDGEYLSPQKIMQVLPGGADIMEQAKINSWASMGSTSKGELLDTKRRLMESPIAQAEEHLNLQRGDLQNVNDKIALIEKSPDSDEARRYIAEKGGTKEAALQALKKDQADISKMIEDNGKEIETARYDLNQFNNTYGAQKLADGTYTFTNADKMSQKERDDLATQVYLLDKKSAYANTFQKNDITIKVEQDKVVADQLAFQRQVELKKIDLQSDLATKAAEAQLKSVYGTGEGSSTTTGGESVMSSSAVQPLAAVPTGAKTEELDLAKLNQNIKSLQTTLGKDDYGTDGTMFNELAATEVMSNVAGYDALPPEQQKSIMASAKTQMLKKIKDYKTVQTQYNALLAQNGNDPNKVLGKEVSKGYTYGDWMRDNANIKEYTDKLDYNKAQADAFIKFKKTAESQAETEALAKSGANFNEDKMIAVDFNYYRNDPSKVVGNVITAGKQVLNTALSIMNPLKGLVSGPGFSTDGKMEGTSQLKKAYLKVPKEIVKDIADRKYTDNTINSLYLANKANLPKWVTLDEFKKEFKEGFNVGDVQFIKKEGMSDNAIQQMNFENRMIAPELPDNTTQTYKDMKYKLTNEKLSKYQIIPFGVPQTFGSGVDNQKDPSYPIHNKMQQFIKGSLGSSYPGDAKNIFIQNWVFDDKGGATVNFAYKTDDKKDKWEAGTLPLTPTFVRTSGLPTPYNSAIKNSLNMEYLSRTPNQSGWRAPALYDIVIAGTKYRYIQDGDESYKVAAWKGDTPPTTADFNKNPVSDIGTSYEILKNRNSGVDNSSSGQANAIIQQAYESVFGKQ